MKIKKIQQILSFFQERQVKQVEIAEALGHSREYISQLFRGDKELSVDKMKVLEKKFNIKFSDYKEKTMSEMADWQKKLNLTDSEMQLFTEVLAKNKEMFLLLAKALNGDTVALERLKKLL